MLRRNCRAAKRNLAQWNLRLFQVALLHVVSVLLHDTMHAIVHHVNRVTIPIPMPFWDSMIPEWTPPMRLGLIHHRISFRTPEKWWIIFKNLGKIPAFFSPLLPYLIRFPDFYFASSFSYCNQELRICKGKVKTFRLSKCAHWDISLNLNLNEMWKIVALQLHQCQWYKWCFTPTL